ncbi:hypothetical protein Tco_1434182, partial [Tanacetum coccineum]
MKAYMERMNQQREQEALLAAQTEQELREQEQAEQELLAQNAEQKQKLEDTMLELLEYFRQKALYCMHNDVEDLIESALNSKLLLINLKSQCLDKEKQEVKNIIEQATKRRTRITESLQNFTIIHKKSSISLKNTPQISPVIVITHDLPSKCDLPVNDESSQTFTTFSNPLFDSNDDFSSSDDESLSNEDVSKENFKIYSNPLFDD